MAEAVQDFTGGDNGLGWGEWLDSAKSSYSDTMDFDVASIGDYGVGLDTPIAMGTAPFVAKTWGGVTPGQALSPSSRRCAGNHQDARIDRVPNAMAAHRNGRSVMGMECGRGKSLLLSRCWGRVGTASWGEPVGHICVQQAGLGGRR